MTPLFSIIIPIYNVEAYLRACLDSVLAQSCGDWEALMVDDASTDSSADIAAEYCRRDRRFSLISLTEKSGPSRSRNAGLDVARGRYLVFIDSDDMIHRNFLSVHREVMESGADISSSAITASFRVFDRSTLDISPKVYSDPIALCLYQRRGVNPSACGKVFSARLFSDGGLRFREGLLYEDLQIMPELMERAAGRIVFMDAPLYFYRQRRGSIIHTFNFARLDVLEVTEEIEKRYADDPVLGPAARDRRFSANFNMFLLLCGRGMADSAEADSCWAQIRRLRLSSMLNRRVRMKNRIGALASILLSRRIISCLYRIGGFS